MCSDLAEYGFQVCQQPAAAVPEVNPPSFSQGPDSIFEDQNAGDEDNNDGDNDDDNDD